MKVLFIVDLQKQFKDSFGEYEKCLEYISANRSSYDKIIATLFTQKNPNPNYIRKLDWEGCSDVDESDLEFALNDVTVITKNGYGLPDYDFDPNDEYFVMGCDADACVMAICFNLWDKGMNFTVLSDYVYTTGKIPKNEILKMYKRNFGLPK